MKPHGLLQAQIAGALAEIGHTQFVVIADAGLPLPKGVPAVDLALRAGCPSFLDALSTILPECVFESYTMASEAAERNPAVLQQVRELLAPRPETLVPHEDFKRLCRDAALIVRTGETSPYANIILVGGVNF